ncbi:MAG: YhdH/YhfP family quinone oxidoreductase [Planctomycetota bacterium]
MSELFSAFVVDQPTSESDEAIIGRWRDFSLNDLDEGNVVIRVAYSALNYKDALASQGNSGVARKFPIVPGIDATGTVIESSSSQVSVGEQVLVAHAHFGTAHCGGFSEMVRVPDSFVYRLPSGMSAEEAIGWGTAGFTAAQSVAAVLDHGVTADQGPVVVTGATGGVGIFAIKILSLCGFEVIASTGKMDQSEWLRSLGASSVVDRNAMNDDSNRPLLKGEFAAAVDAVGGNTLATLLRRVQPHGCVTACGLVGGHELHTTVYPFILRGVALYGIDSANIDRQTRHSIWARIASEWRFDSISSITQKIKPDQLVEALQRISAGKVAGRVVVEF